jgi:two-component system NtrC family sensor kinase
MMAGTVVLPLVLFAYASWIDYTNAYGTARERIGRSLDVLQEHAQRVFEPVNLVFLEVEHLIGELDRDTIRGREPKLSRQLKAIADALTQVEAIWVFDADGKPLVASNVYPAPDQSYRDRDYFAAHVDRNVGLFVGEVLQPRIQTQPPTPPFFAASRRRVDADGKFAGVVQVSVDPGELERFYASIGRYPGAYFAMLRSDGAFLARHPSNPNLKRLGAGTGFQLQVARDPRGGIYRSGSIIDGRERLIGTRKLAGYPIYLSTGIEVSAIHDEWLSAVVAHLVFGVPATAALFAALGVALIRTQRAFGEAVRRERAESALRQTLRLEAIGKLTGGVAHDFNNLLMVVKGAVERMLRDERSAADTRYLGMIKTAAERGQSLTRQLLTFSRQQALNPEVIDLSARLPAIREILERSLRGDIEVRTKVAAEACRVSVDVGELDLAILNLGVNARDAMPAGGTLTLAIRSVTLDGHPEGLIGEFVALSMTDTGIGIAAEMLPRVFDPFFTTKEIGKGTGLGLSQVYGFAKQSGGAAVIESTPAKGTTVTLYLPMSAADVLPIAPAERDETRRFDARVLIVEDNEDVSALAHDLFAELGCSAAIAANVDNALQSLRQERFDVVLSDILLPGGKTGLDLARQIRLAYPHIALLLATGFSASAEEALREGFLVLRKPYGRDDLADALAQVLRGRAQVRSARRA